MPIEGPNLKAKDRGRVSEYVICEGFVFKPASVDAFYHDAINEEAGRHYSKIQIVFTGNLRSSSATL